MWPFVWRSCNALRISNSRCFVSPAGPSARRRSDFLPRFSALVNVPAEETPSVFQSSAVERKIEQLQGARDEIKVLIGRTHCNPILIRLGWHDAGTYDENIREWPKCGGANGSLRFSAELGHEANAGLLNAFKLLLPIKVKFNSVSYADLFQLASATAIELAGGPRIPMKYGRVDALFPHERVKQGNLPSAAASNPGDHLRQVFYRMGFNDQQIVALSGAHTLGRARPERSGWGKPVTKYTNDGPGAPGGQSWTVQWLKFDNSYFKDIKGRKDDDLLVLPTDAVLFEDPGFKIYAEVYAQDEDDFFRDYAQAHARLSELGAKFEPAEGIFIDEPAGDRCLLLSAGSLHKAFSQISRRIFTGRAKRATQADVHRTCAVVRQVEQLEGARYEIKKVIERTHCSSILIRLGWHDARTYDKDITEWPNCGGANGSLRFRVGLGHDADLQNALKLLEPVKEKFNSISYADLFQLASATAIEMAGGPQIPMKYGRFDAAGPGECQECDLSCVSDPADSLRKVFYRMGFNDKEIVALLGAHTLGTETPERSRWGKSETNCMRDGSEALGGESLVVQRLKFDNTYFKDIKQRTDKDLPVLPIDAVLFEDPRFKVYAELYARDIAAFFKDYAQAHAKLSELGTKFKPYKGISIDAIGDAVTACLEALVYWSLSPLRSKGERNSPMQCDPLSGFWNGPIGQRISASISCNLEQLLRDAYFSSGLTEDSVIRWIQDSEVPRLRGEIKEEKTCCCEGCLRLYTRLLVHRRIGEPYHRCLFGNGKWCEEAGTS